MRVTEWFNLLSNSDRESALERFNYLKKRYPHSFADDEVSSLRIAVMDYVDWSNTNEGEEYWSKLYNNLPNVGREVTTEYDRTTDITNVKVGQLFDYGDETYTRIEDVFYYGQHILCLNSKYQVCKLSSTLKVWV